MLKINEKMNPPSKRILFSILLISFISTTSFTLAATWYENFVANYEDKGIDRAVEIAVKDDGRNPDEIIKTALPIEGLDQEILMKALFCSVTKPEVVQSAAVNNGISEQTIWNGYQIAITECRRQLEEWYNFIPPGGPESPSGRPASPWKFN